MVHGSRPNFKTGDVVRLKSGGPKMVVIDAGAQSPGPHGSRIVRCQWMIGKQKHEGDFDPVLLEYAQAD